MTATPVAEVGGLMTTYDVGFDIDDVLFPWYNKAHAACLEAGITNGVVPTTWHPYDEYGCTQEEWWAALEVVTLTGELYRSAPDEFAVREVRRLYFAGHRIHLVTARGFFAHGEVIRHHTEEWLQEYGVPHHSLNYARQKAPVAERLGLDYFIDDNAKNFVDVYDVVPGTYLLDRPWNQHVECSRRVQSVTQYADLIEEAANG